MKLSKIVTIVVAVLAIIGIALYINVSGIDKDNLEELSGPVSTIVSYSWWLFLGAVAITVVLSIWSLIKNPAALKKTLIGLAVLGVLLSVSYFLASDAAVLDAQNVQLEDGAAGSTSKWVGTGIIYSLILGAIGVVFFVLDLLKGLIKS